MTRIRTARSGTVRLAALALLTCTALAATSTPVLGVTQDAKLGPILTANDGMTLYLFTKDTDGVSNCNDQCAKAWPPLMSTALPTLPKGATGKLSLLKRQDGSEQVAYNGKPLYLWVKDTKAGDTTGQGVGKVWYVVKP